MASSELEDSDFLIPKSSVEIGEPIGRGGFSQVWSANVKTPSGDFIQAAAKRVRSIKVDEIQVMKGIKHSNVITFYGVLQQDLGDIFIIMELAENGDLRRYLDRFDKPRLPMALLWKWAFESACGINYLHGIKHTHRDIKSLNYLIMKDFSVKLGDLGLAKVLMETQQTAGVRGTCRWMAPEVIKEQKRSVKSDVFSFGIVLWEVYTTEVPYADRKGDFQVMNAICHGKRPEIPDDCPQELKQLIEECWQEDYHKRPDMEQICKMLQECVQRESCDQIIAQLQQANVGGSSQAGDDDTPMDTLSGSHAHAAHAVAQAANLDTDGHGRTGKPINIPAGPSGDIEMTSASPYTSAQGPMSGESAGSDGSTDTVAMYKMCNVPRGYCLIINNEDFSGARKNGHPLLNDREGSQPDVDKLQYIFTKFKFTVRCVKNLKRDDMYKTLEAIRQEIPSDHDAFVCCFLTHGKLGQLAGSDGEYLEMQKILSLFAAERCPNLRGKPKMFFIQACQGLASHPKHPVNLETDAPPQPQPTGIAVGLDLTIPNHADFLLGFATVPGHVSYRHTVLGSWYISVLTNKLDRLHDKEDLLSILTAVNGKLSKESAKIEGGECGQIPAPITSLRKKVYFTLWEPCAQ